MGRKRMAPQTPWEAWMAAFADRVRGRMERDGIEQHELARTLGMPPSTLSQHLSGRLQPETVQKIEALWADEFSGCLEQALRVKYGIGGQVGLDPVLRGELISALEAIRSVVDRASRLVHELTIGGGTSEAKDATAGHHRTGKRSGKSKKSD